MKSHSACRITVLTLLLLLRALPTSQAQTLPDLISFTFTPTHSNTIPGNSKSPGPDCNGTIAGGDQIQRLGLAALYYQVDCFTDGRYNNRIYPVERGTLSSGAGGPFDAYRFYEPLVKATNFLASRHAIYYKFPTVENYTVYSFIDGTLAKVADVPAASIPDTNTFVLITAASPITVSEVVGNLTYVFVPSAANVSSYSQLAPGVEGARVKATPFGDVLKYRYTVTGAPFDSALDFSAGPNDFSNTYSDRRRFFLVRNGATIGVVWQQTNLAVNLTWFGADRKSPSTVTLANPSSELLACATGDDAGNVYYLTAQAGDGSPNATRHVTLTRAGSTGSTITTATVDSSAAGFNMVQFEGWSASMKYLNGNVAVMIGRKMTQSGDGLNHQGGIAVVFDGNSLATLKNWGQTSGHSWENVLTTNTNGQFVGIDMGDNFPRGINLHKFTTASKNSRVISTYKTEHGTTPQNPAGSNFTAYTEISITTNYYRWSNDNGTYTELGGVAQTSVGYAAAFAGERSPAGKLIDNARVGNSLNDPRNLAFITVIPNFETASGGGTEVSDDLVVTSGLVETNGYYNFTGGWTPQRNAGVVWLTTYSSLSQNVSRLKMCPRADNTLLLMWEIWTGTAYTGTRAMRIAENGTILNAETDLTSQVRLGRRDDPMRYNSDIFLAAGKKADNTIELIVFEGASVPTPGATTLAATSITGTGATLNGTANPNGSTTFGFFQWGTNTSYGQTTATTNVGSGTSAVTLAIPIGSLTAGQTYHFRAAASNSFGVVYGGDLFFTPIAPTGITLVSNPQPQTVTEGGTASFSVSATGTAPLAFQWRRNQTNLVDGGGISGSLSSNLTLLNVQLAQAGNYDVIVTNSINSKTSTPALLVVNSNTTPTLASALNGASLVWATSGNANWFPQTTNTHDGVSAAQSGEITHNESSTLQTSVTGPGTLSFWWQVSCEANYDGLVFTVDGTNPSTNTGITGWSQVTKPITAGTHTLTWTYVKDFSDDAGLDAGWVDEVSFASSVVTPPTLSLTPSGSNLKISWTNTASNFTVQYKTNLTDAAWLPLTGVTISNEPGNLFINVNSSTGARFYRLSSP